MPDELRRRVGGHHHLLAQVGDGIVGVQELLLRRPLVGQEVNVVDDQHVQVAVAVPECVALARPNGVHEVVGERLAGNA